MPDRPPSSFACVLEARAARIDSLIPVARRFALLERAVSARTVGQRIHWLRVEADQVSSAASAVSPCRRGCSHCCHIGVLVSRTEAQQIAREIGQPLCQPDEVISLDVQADIDPRVLDEAAARYRGVPCPFLVGDACSIYRHRPLACRRQISLANDSSPCRLQEQEDTDVPYLDRFDAKVAYVLAMGSHTAYADLREWFAARPSPKS